MQLQRHKLLLWLYLFIFIVMPHAAFCMRIMLSTLSKPTIPRVLLAAYSRPAGEHALLELSPVLRAWADKKKLQVAQESSTGTSVNRDRIAEELTTLMSDNNQLEAHRRWINEVDEHGDSKLHNAVNLGDKETVLDLIILGAALDARNEAGATPLHRAASLGNIEIMSILIAHGAKVKDDIGVIHRGLFTDYSRRNEVVEFLASHGAPLNTLDEKGQTVLHKAANYGWEDIVAILIAHGADVNMLNARGQPPLYYAILEQRHEIIRMFVKKGLTEDTLLRAMIKKKT
jgi:ankyrin repeat protein